MLTADVPSPRDGRANELRLQIRELIREARQQRKISQADLGSAIGKNRFLIIRIEKGEQDLTLDQAEQLDQVLGTTELAALVRRLGDTAGTTADNQRDPVVRRLLRETPALESVTIVVADDLDVFGTIYDSSSDSPRLDAREVNIIFPSVERERQLFGGQPLYGHIEYQIKHLADLQGSEYRPFGSLRVFESDDVLTSCVIASTRTGTQCAYWPPLPIATKVQGGKLPVMSTVDTYTNGRLEAHVAHLLAGREPLRTNEALCRVDEATTKPRFTRYFAVGTDQEEDVAEDEGFAVALVLAVALCPRKHYGVAPRVIMYKRPSARHDRGRLSLFSNNVDDADIRAARSIEAGTDPEVARSTRGALAATLDINDYLRGKDGVIPDLAFQIAAAREFAMFGLDVAPERLRPIQLPTDLRLIHKPAAGGRPRAAVAPHVFALELDPTGAEPELDVLSATADSEVIGIDDIAESSRLNSFLVMARDGGFLLPLMESLGVAGR
ncbi:helix-turn-helix transcriptional regulator [Plantactinospora soyae]|nr:helix-turn-helix transcriptional regulator [Plantactinospora soyae]